MPEGHTVHRLALDHSQWFSGQQLGVLSPQGRFAEEAERLDGQTFLRAEAHGKHLFHYWSEGDISHIHLGLYGKFRRQKNPAAEPRGAVRMRLIGQGHTLDLNGPNQCELLEEPKREKLLARLGEDPLRDDADPERVWQKMQKSRVAVGTLLLNQSVIAGIGNVYRAEILFMTGICPDRPANEISREEFQQIWDLSVDLLTTGVKYNRIITVDRETLGKPLSRANSRERTWIYKSIDCPRCGRDVYYWDLGNRTIYACQHCQT
ncbi:MAG: Fpg/Nei family DNA glycosylase [Pirellulaceae bacterium]|jgi:endonuclease-8|nr:Fpg/Nei family DNA glycosylase [Pirellulaceae bacterium]